MTSSKVLERIVGCSCPLRRAPAKRMDLEERAACMRQISL
jgi:hypothetical protein